MSTTVKCRQVRNALLAVIVGVNSAMAYEVQTHADITLHAADSSVLESYLRTQLRIDPNVGLDVETITRADVNPNGTPRNWMREGSVREDDIIPIPRPFNHFYNPLNGQGLTFGLTIGEPAPSWALEDVQWYGTQQFSLSDAHQYFFDALTSSSQFMRDHNLASMFRSLGQVMHVLEDMAQPQHTRNDSHLVHAYYERYTDHMRGFLPFDGYGAVYWPVDQSLPFRFDAPRKFSHTNESDVQDRKGLADYSNRGFVSEGTNFVSNPFMPGRILWDPMKGFPDPSGEDAVGWQPAIDLLPACKWTNPSYQPHGLLAFVQTTVHDAFTGEDSINPMTSTESVFDPDLDLHSQSKTFSLNCYTFELAQQLLIPRAVGYSAGLINYFFRGKIDFACDYADPSKPCVIKNLGPDNLYGVFELWAENAAGERTLAQSWGTNQCDSSGCTVITGIPVESGKSTRVGGFTAPENASRYVLVFRGKMGLEPDAVVGKVISNSFLLMSIAATYQYHPSDLPADSSWQQLGPGPLNYTLHERQLRGSAQGAAINERVLFASFANSMRPSGYPTRPLLLWKSTDGGRTFVEVSEKFSPDRRLNAVTSIGGTQLLAAFTAGRNPPFGGGFAYSDDLGENWEPLTSFAANQAETGILAVGDEVVIAQGAKTGDGSGLLRSTDNGRTWSEAKPFIDGAQWTCPNFEPGSSPAPQCTTEWQNYQNAYYHETHNYVWRQVCDESLPDGCNCVHLGVGSQVDCSGYYPYFRPELFPTSNSCSCSGTCCAGNFLEPDLMLLDALYDAYAACWVRTMCTGLGVTVEPPCYGKWETYTMAWNNISGEGSVVLAGGRASRVDSNGGFPIGQLGIWKSSDGGEHWRLVMDTRTICNPDDLYTPIRREAPVISVAVSPSGEALAITEEWVYESDAFSSLKKLYRSIDAGETWNEIASPAGSGVAGVMYLSGVPFAP